MDLQKITDMIDYTLLNPITTKEDSEKFCKETITYGFKTVFVNPYYISYV
ncbi:deoxyribose-phosphate aldolase [Paraliobacillus ryukyuensis]|uniref:Deoxyribose-phosphate aldolase n=1 Tax=Paraliobacillus ryukyuensis TaxID=200904 RepID=A0A366EG40_9BACI|nr:hypothetical protein [Paraliobacillus ryukyuensis]RBP00399.1 hypothetical protein DES48_102161 [Paraliobacillus ryukyuensis]